MKEFFSNAWMGIKGVFNRSVEVAKKTTAVIVGVGTGVVAMISDAHAAITLDTTTILADIATVGTAVIGISLAIAAFAIGLSMLRKGRS